MERVLGMMGFRLILGAVAVIGMAIVAGNAIAADAPMRDDGMQAGLAVDYYYGDFGHVDEVLEYASRKSSAQGEPLANVDYRGGDGKPVLNQRHKDFVAALITGYIYFSAPGTYMFKVRSNDGVRISIGGLTVHEDARPHPDRTSDPLPVKVSAAGWLPIEIVYFERKGGWSIELTWQDGGDFSAVPASHFAH